jgi:hypothetical protein
MSRALATPDRMRELRTKTFDLAKEHGTRQVAPVGVYGRDATGDLETEVHTLRVTADEVHSFAPEAAERLRLVGGTLLRLSSARGLRGGQEDPDPRRERAVIFAVTRSEDDTDASAELARYSIGKDMRALTEPHDTVSAFTESEDSPAKTGIEARACDDLHAVVDGLREHLPAILARRAQTARQDQ